MSRSPGATGFGGQCLVTTSLGLGAMGQTAVAVAVTLLLRQTSVPRAVTVSAIFVSQILVGTRKLPAKSDDSPGAKVSGPTTGVLFVGSLSTTKTLNKVMLPLLLTVPVNIMGWPKGTGPDGQ